MDNQNLFYKSEKTKEEILQIITKNGLPASVARLILKDVLGDLNFAIWKAQQTYSDSK